VAWVAGLCAAKGQFQEPQPTGDLRRRGPLTSGGGGDADGHPGHGRLDSELGTATGMRMALAFYPVCKTKTRWPDLGPDLVTWHFWLQMVFQAKTVNSGVTITAISNSFEIPKLTQGKGYSTSVFLSGTRTSVQTVSSAPTRSMAGSKRRRSNNDVQDDAAPPAPDAAWRQRCKWVLVVAFEMLLQTLPT